MFLALISVLLAYLIEESPKLQELASISDKLICTLAECLHKVDLPELQYVKLRQVSQRMRDTDLKI